MKTRIITAIAALAVLAVVLLSPPMVFNIALAAVIFIMLHECYTSAKASRLVMITGFVCAAGIMAAVYESIYYAVPIWDNNYLAGTILFTVLAHMGITVAEHGRSDYKEVLSSGFLTLYITLSMSCLALTKAEYNIMLMGLIFVCAWTTDTGAYFTGKFLGKRKLIPHVSPNKTVEGAVGGTATAIISCIIYLIIYINIYGDLTAQTAVSAVIGGLIIGGVSAVCSQLGDLAASAIKRDTGVKDFGKIFPGHGGFMDRFDSVLFISPIIYFLLHTIII